MERVRTNISMPKGLPQRAHNAGVNISATATKAVLREIKIAEKETGIAPSKATLPAVHSQGATP
jgi:post-segregation antitoxin (ccd killing protein)